MPSVLIQNINYIVATLAILCGGVFAVMKWLDKRFHFIHRRVDDLEEETSNELTAVKTDIVQIKTEKAVQAQRLLSIETVLGEMRSDIKQILTSFINRE